MPDVGTKEPLHPEAGARLIAFARVCAASVRALTLYPAAHPSVDTALSRLMECARVVTADEALRLTALPATLMIDGRAPAKTDPAVAELAAALHLHRVGGMTVRGAGKATMWQRLLGLIGRPVDEIREAGGLGHLWSDSSGMATAEYLQCMELREVDYERLLSRQSLGDALTLEEIFFGYLESADQEAMGPAAQALLAEIVCDADNLALFGVRLAERCADRTSHAQALSHLFRQATERVGEGQAGAEANAIGNLATLMASLDAPTLAELLRHRHDDTPIGRGVNTIAERVEPEQIVSFVSKSVVSDQGASQRLAEAFQALVPDIDERRKLVSLAGNHLAESPFGQDDEFPKLWEQAESLLTSYSDQEYVSAEYAHELASVRTQAIQVEHVSDDPPERIASWLSTVDDPALRSLDSQLLLDLLTLETDAHRWRDVADTVCAHVDALALVGDLDWARRFVETLAATRGHRLAWRAPNSIAHFAAEACDRLTTGSMLGHALARLGDDGDTAAAHIAPICDALGPATVTPLAAALTANPDARVRRTVQEILLGFGADGRAAVRQLLNAPEWEARQTAAFLLREFSAGDGLDELKQLLNDSEPRVQREAIRAMILAGDGRAYEILVSVLNEADAGHRATLAEQLTAQRDPRAVSLCRYLLTHLSHRKHRTVQIAAIQTLGAVGSEGAVEPLRGALYDGVWWSPLRTRTVRQAAAQALRRTRLRSAAQVLREAADHGSWGVRAAARAEVAHLEGRA
ncbi:MAG: HEAT repeat domain-containing protein [Acidobacteria bacterium]|nr:HEAT repeat domain-containing protein [Acidobacteriota bacterium]